MSLHPYNSYSRKKFAGIASSHPWRLGGLEQINEHSWSSYASFTGLDKIIIEVFSTLTFRLYHHPQMFALFPRRQWEAIVNTQWFCDERTCGTKSTTLLSDVLHSVSPLPITSCVTLVKSPKLSVSQFLHLLHRDINSTYISQWLRLNEIINTKHLL